jgi:alanine dehydrogenase
MVQQWVLPQVVGVLSEVKANERRVALTPNGAKALMDDGRLVVVQAGAGLGSGFSDREYSDAGAIIVNTPHEVFTQATLLLHVKEPQATEFQFFQPHHTLFTYLHLAAEAKVADALCASGCRAIAYESVEIDRHYPLLAPMSAVAGRLATQLAASFLEARNGGRGVLLGGIPGVEPATVLVIGAGVSGRHAAEVAAGMGAEVIIADINLDRAQEVAALCGPRARAVQSGPEVIEHIAPECEVMIGAVLSPGHRAPQVITSRILELMPEGAVVVDIAIDQGGCVEGVQATSHTDPVRSMGHVRVSATPNMPAAVPRTSTTALTAATLPYIRALAAGWTHAVTVHPELVGAVNVQSGEIVHPAIREELAKR